MQGRGRERGGRADTTPPLDADVSRREVSNADVVSPAAKCAYRAEVRRTAGVEQAQRMKGQARGRGSKVGVPPTCSKWRHKDDRRAAGERYRLLQLPRVMGAAVRLVSVILRCTTNQNSKFA